jgi:hypothetical protein
MVDGMLLQKRNALSRNENMGGSISPVLKPCEAEVQGYVFKCGLVGPFSASLLFSNLDIFIEKPFPVLSLADIHTAVAIKRERSPIQKVPSQSRWRQARTFRQTILCGARSRPYSWGQTKPESREAQQRSQPRLSRVPKRASSAV